jgi:hypothetical protein
MEPGPRVPDPARGSFARTNRRTIEQRVALMHELLPGVRSIAEVCAGDCSVQAELYRRELGVERYLAVDLDLAIVAANRSRGIATMHADALDAHAMRPLAEHDVVFFGPPLSEDCDGHRILGFDEVRPGYEPFARLLLGELRYQGLLVCIAPRSTDMGHVQKLHHAVRSLRPDYALSLIHHSWSEITGRGDTTEPRLKYVELWFSTRHADEWAVRESGR